jgi:hypothetical protein
MLQKARRYAEGRAAGRDRMNGYMYGDNDFIDHKVLEFLRVDDTALLEIVRAHPTDDDAARIVLERSRRGAEECREFSLRLRRNLGDFSLIEADEGRMAPGPKRTLIRFFYQHIMMPVVTVLFSRAERKRTDRSM